MRTNIRKVLAYCLLAMLTALAIVYLYVPFINAPFIVDYFVGKRKWAVVAAIFILFSFLLVKRVGMQNALLSLFSLFFSLLIIDYCLHARIVRLGKAHDLDNIPFHVQFLTKEWYKIAVLEKMYDKEILSPGQVSVHLPDDDFYEIRRMRVSTDELGLRNKPGNSKAPQDVIIIGDSFAFGYGCDQTKIWSNILAADSGLKVYNAAVYGIGPSHAVELLGYLLENNLIHLSDNATVFMTVFSGNDFTDENLYTTNRSKPAVLWRIYQGYMADGLVFQLLNRIYTAIHSKGGGLYRVYSSPSAKCTFHNTYINAEIRDNATWKDAEAAFEKSSVPKSFQRLRDLSEKYHFHPVVFYIPTKARAYLEIFKDIPRLPEDRMEDLTGKEARRLFAGGYYDFTGLFQDEARKGMLTYWKDDTHLNDYGQRLLSMVSMSMMHLEAGKAGSYPANHN